jgi:hypothetical protein
MRQFQKQSTQPLTAESYRRAAARATKIAGAIEDLGRAMGVAPMGLSPPAHARLTRAIKDLAAHSARLLERHKEQT